MKICQEYESAIQEYNKAKEDQKEQAKGEDAEDNDIEVTLDANALLSKSLVPAGTQKKFG